MQVFIHNKVWLDPCTWSSVAAFLHWWLGLLLHCEPQHPQHRIFINSRHIIRTQITAFIIIIWLLRMVVIVKGKETILLLMGKHITLLTEITKSFILEREHRVLINSKLEVSFEAEWLVRIPENLNPDKIKQCRVIVEINFNHQSKSFANETYHWTSMELNRDSFHLDPKRNDFLIVNRNVRGPSVHSDHPFSEGPRRSTEDQIESFFRLEQEL